MLTDIKFVLLFWMRHQLKNLVLKSVYGFKLSPQQ